MNVLSIKSQLWKLCSKSTKFIRIQPHEELATIEEQAHAYQVTRTIVDFSQSSIFNNTHALCKYHFDRKECLVNLQRANV